MVFTIKVLTFSLAFTCLRLNKKGLFLNDGDHHIHSLFPNCENFVTIVTIIIVRNLLGGDSFYLIYYRNTLVLKLRFGAPLSGSTRHGSIVINFCQDAYLVNSSDEFEHFG
jgi:hypothetical protein